MIQSGAQFSECRRYRYHLWRVWADESPIMVFVMMNPSTADEVDNDPTIRKCIHFAKRDGFGGISVRNVFAFRATKPCDLIKAADPFGPENEIGLLHSRGVCLMTRLVVAWGKPIGGRRLAGYYQRVANACQINSPYCLGVNNDGSPKHPLFLRNDTPIVPWSHEGIARCK